MRVIDVSKLSPPDLWVMLCDQVEFPVRLEFGADGVLVGDKSEARVFGLGLHFGDIMRCKQEGIET